MNTLTLGILGGLGPMSGIYFCELLTAHTKADCDREHLNFLLSSRADTPDRTDFILGISQSDPTDTMVSEVRRLADAGADIIAIPCNTAHYFYERIAEASSIPIINIIEQTAAFCHKRGLKKVAVLSTEGTAKSGAYRSVLDSIGIELIPCTDKEQAIISDIIYNNIKKGITPHADELLPVLSALRERGAEAVILGCTELSLLKRAYELGAEVIDSLEVLALCAIRLCGKEPCGFDEALMNFYPERKDVL